MKSIQQLHDAAKLQRLKSEGLRRDADKHREKAKSYSPDDDPSLAINENDAAQKLEEKAGEHDKQAMEFDNQALTLEQKALELEHKKQDVISESQSQIDRIDEEERKIRG